MHQQRSRRDLAQRLSNQEAYVTINNSSLAFDCQVPNGAVVHWAAHAKPLLNQALEAFTNDSMKRLTFAELQVQHPDIYRKALEGLNFVVRSGGSV